MGEQTVATFSGVHNIRWTPHPGRNVLLVNNVPIQGVYRSENMDVEQVISFVLKEGDVISIGASENTTINALMKDIREALNV